MSGNNWSKVPVDGIYDESGGRCSDADSRISTKNGAVGWNQVAYMENY